MLRLYPDIHPYAEHRLAVQPPHELFIEECGNPQGLPAVFLHGGPGAGCEPYHRCFFDPNRYRIVLFDQRGAGRSTPHASLEHNTTQQLIADVEAIRAKLSIERWVVFGGSWGSTLGLAYAEAHPDRVVALVLRGIFLCRPWEIRWFYQEGASRLFPDRWQEFIAPIPEDERGDPVAAHYRRLVGNDEVARMRSAEAWSLWEGHTATLLPRQSVIDFFSAPHTALSLARIEAHYFMHQAFLEPDQLLREAPKLADVPGYIIHGRYDVVCPLQNAWELAQAWPRGRLEIVPEAGHAASEVGIVHALVQATNEIADLFYGGERG